MRALVIGGAGYIGGTTAQLLAEAGHTVCVADNLSTGHEAYALDLRLEKIDIHDTKAMDALFKSYKPDIVLHFAAKIQVAESVKDPFLYFHNNTYGTLGVLNSMRKHGVRHIVFSSTAAVYGNPVRIPIQEDDIKKPINPYGTSKYLSEQLLESYGNTHNINWAAFRYFNAAGVYKNIAMDYPVMTHLIPHATEAALGGKTLQVFGNNYDTRDGTCIRDFVHVIDIARAHVLAAESMVTGTTIQAAMNLGSSSGYSVLEVISTMKEVTGRDIPYIAEDRRAGDPAILIADSSRAKTLLDWSAKRDLKDMVQSHYEWRAARQQ